MQDLQDDLAAFGVHRRRDRLEFVGLCGGDQKRARFLEQPVRVGGIVTGDDQGGAAAGALGIERGQPFDRVIERFQAGVHRAHQGAVAQGVRADPQRRQQGRKSMRRTAWARARCEG